MPTISLCMIVKNEEQNIANCLNSVKDLVDEIIIVDTGSKDKTKEVIKEAINDKGKNLASKGKIFDIKIFDFKWNDDFSAARNESLKHATKEWILVLDADEELEGASVQAIKSLLNDNSGKYDAFLLLQKNYTDDTSITGFVHEAHTGNKKTFPGWYGSYIARLFINNKGYDFYGAVHELVEPSIESRNGKIAVSDLVIHNYGNISRKAVHQKRKYYLELCKKKINEKESPHGYYELGILYRENNETDKAIESFKKSISLDSKYAPSLYELGIIYEKRNDYDNAIKYYTESLRIKESSDAFQSLGVCYIKKAMLKEAYRNLAKALVLNPNKYSIYNNLGAVFERLGNFEKALEMLDIGIKLFSSNVIGYYNRAVVYDKKGKFEDALKDYEKAVELGHGKSGDIKKRIEQLKGIIASSPSYGYSFKFGG